jgi:hypothetical protein
MAIRPSRPILLLTLGTCFSTLFTAGCVKQVRSSVPAFAQAAELTSTNVQAAFTTVNQTYNSAQRIHYAVTYVGTEDPSKIPSGWLPPETLNVRLQVLQGLKQYASDLSSLTGSNDVDSLNKASTAVGKSLTDLTKTEPFKQFAADLPTDISNEAGTAVDALGNWLIELKLKNSLPALIEKVDPTIQSICVLLVEDIGAVNNDPAHPSKGYGLRQVLWNQYNDIIRSQNQYILKNQCKEGKREPENCFTPQERLSEIEKLPALVEQRNETDETLQQVQATVKQLARAHTELLKAAQTKQTLTADLGDLVAESERLNTYYGSLSKSK